MADKNKKDNKVRVFWVVKPKHKKAVEKEALKRGISPSELIGDTIEIYL